ncbi:MAG: lipid-A-disaccharide synthase [Rikenellaceae bacterium]|nr:lipid-A-disaccharide synthase [Rikenellaceae bacterium]
MKYYIIAGEPSGDLHGSNLIKGLKKSDPEGEFRFWGGDLMADAGGEENLVCHYKESSFMGFWEVFKNLNKIFGQINDCKKDILDYGPDVVILIDYAGFNLRIAEFAKKNGIKTFYYIAPKVWAWKESRIKKIKKYVDKLFIIFPFESEYFQKQGIDAVYCGNPLMDSIEQRKKMLSTPEEFKESNGLDKRPIIALLAGSRKHEIDYNFHFMIQLSKKFPEYQFVVAGVSWLDRSVYDKYMSGSDVQYVCDKTYELLNYSTAAIVTSGTATLEAALLGIPEIVCFWSSWPSYYIAKKFIKVKYISLVNLILNREAVRELIQKDMNLETAEKELRTILPEGEKYKKLKSDYKELGTVIGGCGASDRFAAKMVEILKTKNK